MTRTVTIARLDAGDEGIYYDVRVEVIYFPSNGGLRDRCGGWMDPGNPSMIEDFEMLSFTSDNPGDLRAWIATHEDEFIERLFDALDR